MPHSAVANDPFLNRRISHYHIIAKLGQGSMGVVYKATDAQLHRPVAIKFLAQHLIADPQALQRFKNEAIAASAINHPNICTIYEIKSQRNIFFIVMEYIEGRSLRDILINRYPLPQSLIIDYIRQIGRALSAAHQSGLVHRDVKPDNLLLCEKIGMIKLTDFGLAKLASESIESQFEESEPLPPYQSAADFIPGKLASTYSNLLGTPAYMSPEQARAEKVDRRTDIFSLGIIIHEMLTGQRPFQGSNPVEVMRKIVLDQIEIQRLPIDKRWQRIIAKTLEKDKNKRYQAVEELMADLPSKHSPIPIGSRPKHWKKISLAVLFLILLAASFVGYRYRSVLHADRSDRPGAEPASRGYVLPAHFSSRAPDVGLFFGLGYKAYQAHWDQGAVENLQMAVERDTTFAYANALLGIILEWMERPDEANAALMQATRNLAAASSYEQLLIRGYLAFYYAHAQESIQLFDKAITDFPERIDGYLGAFLAYERKDYSACAEYCRRIIQLDPGHILAHGRCSDYCMRSGKFSEAAWYAKKEIELMHSSGDSMALDKGFELLGRALHLQAKGDSAILALEKSIALAPANRDTYQFLAEAYALNGDLDRAEQLLRKLLAWPYRSSERSQIYEWLAGLMIFSGRYLDAISDLQKAKTLSVQDNNLPQVLVLSSKIVNFFYELGQPAAAEREWQATKALVSGKNTPFKELLSQHQTGFEIDMAIRKGEFAAVDKKLAALKRIGASENVINSQLISIGLATGKTVEAKERLLGMVRKSQRFDTEQDIGLKFTLASIYAQERNYEQAVKFCQQALQVRRLLVQVEVPAFHWAAVNLLSDLYEKMNMRNNSVELCKRYLHFHQNADSELTITREISRRLSRLGNS